MSKRHIETNGDVRVTRGDLVALLNDDLAREYQAIISYVIYSTNIHESTPESRPNCKDYGHIDRTMATWNPNRT